MWVENPIFREDLERLAQCEFIPWDEFAGKTFFVTGGTGLIGYTLISALLYYNKTRNADIRVLALVRDMRKGKEKFSELLAENCGLELISGDIDRVPQIEEKIDYIVHSACPTASAFFVEKPVETISAVVLGTKNMLELAREKQAMGFAYLSSMEVYGAVTTQDAQKETELGYIDLFSPRSSYPESKRLAENLCCSYTAEYGVPTTVVRLAQTFGPGVTLEDGRVFAYAARCALRREDICLKTAGTKENMYLYTADAVSAILLTLAKGARGEAYNVGAPETYCSVRELAEIAARELGDGTSKVVVNTAPQLSGMYPPESRLKLNVEKLKQLGWNTKITLPEMFLRMTAGMGI